MSIFSFWKKRKKDSNVEIPTDVCDEEVFSYIPKYSKEDFENAKIDNSDGTKHLLFRQMFNGYVSYFDDWLVGRNEQGEIVKTQEILKYESPSRKESIDKVQSKAQYGRQMLSNKYCKFTHLVSDGDTFAFHVELVKDYVENEVYSDCGHYGGIHFVPINKIEACANHNPTHYGNKVAIIRPLPDEVYYKYLDDVYEGDKVYVEKIMDLDNVATWEYLNSITESIKSNKSIFIDYLETMPDAKIYSACISYIRSL